MLLVEVVMFEDYLNAAMHLAKYELLESDEGFYGFIELTLGVYASADTPENCRDLLREVLEGWLLLQIAGNQSLPVARDSICQLGVFL
jgi:predicted RNase H-like HicB family nuclease